MEPLRVKALYRVHVTRQMVKETRRVLRLEVVTIPFWFMISLLCSGTIAGLIPASFCAFKVLSCVRDAITLRSLERQLASRRSDCFMADCDPDVELTDEEINAAMRRCNIILTPSRSRRDICFYA